MKAPLHALYLAFLAPFALSSCPSQVTGGDSEFVVMVYNIENLFDIDGVAVFDDYRQSGSPHDYPYDETKFFSKLETIGKVVQSINDGKGPEVILFQELELDQTNNDVHLDYPKILEEFQGATARDLLKNRPEKLDNRLRKMPAHWWLHKHLADIGLGNYHVAAAAPPADLSFATSHVNAVFSRFPIKRQQSYVLENARDILETHLEVDGAKLILLNNHWKSGASDPEMEAIRLGNARVLRHRLDEILREDPLADVLLAGDFNSHYNHSALFPAFKKTGINHVLGSQGDETALIRRDGPPLYNLWFELPVGERWSEFYQGELGTLMNLIVSRGLYDGQGFQYVDNSFAVARLPGINTYPVSGLPMSWRFFSRVGGGASDHLPIYAKFRRIGQDDGPLAPGNAQGSTAPNRPMRYDFSKIDLGKAKPMAELAALSDEELAIHVGEIVQVDAPLLWRDPPLVLIGNRLFQLYAYDRKIEEAINQLRTGNRVVGHGELEEYKGRLELIIHSEHWLRRAKSQR